MPRPANETTAYYARVLKADVPLALDVLSDILTNPAFDATELEREKNVIVQEIGAAEDTPDDIVFDHLQTTAFPDQPLGRSVLGTRESVCSFDADSLNAYLSRNYRGPDMVVVAAGAIEHARIVGRGAAAVCEILRTRRPDAGARALCRRHLCRAAQARTGASCLRAAKASPQRDPTLFSLQVFTSVLGGGMSSRLFQEVREIRGLCYTIYTFHMPYADAGLFGLYAGTDAKDAPELMQVVIDEIGRAAETIEEVEIARAKAQMKAGLMMALESIERAGRAACAPDHGLWPADAELSEIVAKIDAVTVESARAAGRALIRRSRPAIAALGPGRGLEQRRGDCREYRAPRLSVGEIAAFVERRSGARDESL